jgi:hypothetical protein
MDLVGLGMGLDDRRCILLAMHLITSINFAPITQRKNAYAYKLLQTVSAALAILVGPMSGSILWADSQKRPESEIDGDKQAKRAKALLPKLAERTALNSASRLGALLRAPPAHPAKVE